MPHSHVLYISKTFTRWSTHSLFVHTLGWLSLFKKEYAHVALYKMNSVCYCLKNQIAMNEKWIFDMTVVLKNEAQNKILWLLILWNVMILKYHEIHTAEKPFVCRMCEEKVWNVMRRYTQEKCLLLAGCGMIHFEMLGGYTHRRKALYLHDVMCDETFWNIMRRYTREKSPLPAGCVKRHSVNIMRRYTQERGDVGQGLCQSEMSCKDTNDKARRKCEMSMRRYKQEKSLLLAGCAMRHFEMLGGYTHRRKALYLQDVMCDETFWNITRRYTREKSPLPAGCVKRHSVNIMRRYTQERGMWDKTFANQKCHAKIHMIKALCL